MSGYEITSSTGTADGLGYTRWTLTVDGDEAAFLDAHTATGLILNVEVEKPHRGEGYARALYEHADAQVGLYHVPAWGRTPEGNAFAEAMGGDTMDDEQAAAILDLDLEVVTGAAFE